MSAHAAKKLTVDPTDTQEEAPLSSAAEQELEALSQAVRTCAAAIATGFESLHKAALLEQNVSTELVATGAQQCETQREVQSCLAGTLEILSHLANTLLTIQTDLDEVAAMQGTLLRDVNSLRNLSHTGSYLAVQASVEGACVGGTTGAEFEVAAESIRKLAESSYKMCGAIANKVASSSHTLQDQLRGLGDLERHVLLYRDSVAGQARGVDHGADLHNYTLEQACDDAKQSAATVMHNVNQAIRGIQFEDLAIQLIQEIRNGMPKGQSAAVVSQDSMSAGGFKAF